VTPPQAERSGARSEPKASEALKSRIEALPTTPGVYLFKSAKDRVLYVGKAQSLKARVRSYFGGGDGRVQVPDLVRRVADVSVFVTPSVKEALRFES